MVDLTSINCEAIPMQALSLIRASKKVASVIVALGLLLTHSMQPVMAGDVLEKILDSGTLRVATDSNWPPQSFVNNNNEMDGFDVDVARQIAKRLGVRIEFITPSWDLIVAGNWRERWDLHVGSMKPDSKIGQRLKFPAVYYYTPSVIAVHREANSSDLSNLNGKTIGAGIGTSHEAYLRGKPVTDLGLTPPFMYLIKNAKIKTYEYPQDAIDDLSSGDGVVLHAVIAGMSTIMEAISKGSPIKIIGNPVFYEPLVISIEPGDREFHDKLAEIIREMHTDGTLSRLSIKWYDFDYSRTE